MSVQWLEESRARTLALVDGLSDDELCSWPDPAFSPICWHLGHIAYTEASWMLEHCAGHDGLSKPYYRRYAQDGCAKSERADGFERSELYDYMQRVRRAITTSWPTLDHPLRQHDFLTWFLAAHEDQHRETIRIVRALGTRPEQRMPEPDDAVPTIVDIPGGSFFVGTDSPLAYDNERPRLAAHVDAFRIDVHPTTCAAWQHFAIDGYQRRELWSDDGWAWLESSNVSRPRAPMLDPKHPVMGISHHEAEAYARFRGGRLPTELEWEYLARRFEGQPHLDTDGPRRVRDGAKPTDLIGNVWEWTADWFEARQGFAPHPYHGYSAPYFDATHRVMRGGSFATSSRIATASFRNWYVPESRQLFVGVRVAYDV